MSEAKKPLTAEQLIKRAWDRVSDLCHGRASWTMRVPAEPDNDSDLIIGAALAAGEKALQDLDAERAKVEALTASLDRANNNRDMWRAQCTVQATTLEALQARATAAEAEAERLREAIDYAIGQIDKGAPDNAGDELRRALAKEKPDAD